MSGRGPGTPAFAWASARPRISVVLIFLDAEEFIEEAISSVFAQDFQDLELLLVDDGSREPCASLARRCASEHAPFVRYLQHPGGGNRGMSAARNLGIASASGVFIAFIDADDVWEPTKLREQLAILETHPELGMVTGATCYWSSWAGGDDRVVLSGHMQDRVIRPPQASLHLYPLGRAAAPCPSDFLLRKETITRIGGFEEHFTGAHMLYEDQGFLAKLYLTSAVYFSSRVWLNYRQHGASCMAGAEREGSYDETRRYFLTWFQGYLAARPASPRRVRYLVEYARFADDHPRLRWAIGRLGAARRRLRQTSRAVLTLLGKQAASAHEIRRRST